MDEIYRIQADEDRVNAVQEVMSNYHRDWRTRFLFPLSHIGPHPSFGCSLGFPKMYLSGAITGHDKAATERKFKDAEQEARRRGYVPVSPLNNGLPESASYEQHMARDLEMLRTCSAVLMLPDWEESPGARRELREAVEHDKKIIFYKPQKDNTMENLLNCNGFFFKAKIDGNDATGRIRVENERVYLCQDKVWGTPPKNCLGYRFGWFVSKGTPEDLKEMNVTDFRLMTQEEAEGYNDWHVGDEIEDEDGIFAEIIFRSGELVVTKDGDNQAGANATCDELYYDRECRLRLPDGQLEALEAGRASVREVTMDEIAEKFGVPVGDLKIKKDQQSLIYKSLKTSKMEKQSENKKFPKMWLWIILALAGAGVAIYGATSMGAEGGRGFIGFWTMGAGLAVGAVGVIGAVRLQNKK